VEKVLFLCLRIRSNPKDVCSASAKIKISKLPPPGLRRILLSTWTYKYVCWKLELLLRTKWTALRLRLIPAEFVPHSSQLLFLPVSCHNTPARPTTEVTHSWSCRSVQLKRRKTDFSAKDARSNDQGIAFTRATHRSFLTEQPHTGKLYAIPAHMR